MATDTTPCTPFANTPDPTSVTSETQYMEAMHELRISVGNPSLRDLTAQANRWKRGSLPRSTLSAMLTRSTVPQRWPIIEAYLRACGLDNDQAIKPWRRAWEQITHGKIAHSPALASREFLAPRQLPIGVSSFIGRNHELDQLDALADGGYPVMVIQGMPGVGKSALALHWAHRRTNEFSDGQIFINLGSHSSRGARLSATEALGQALRALNVPDERIPAGQDERAALFRTHLANRRVLIMLDDAVDPDQIRPLLPGTPTCTVLVTARAGMHDLVVHQDARALALDPLPPAEALDLLRAVVGPDEIAAEPEASKELVKLCGRLPLALRIVAARLHTSHHRQTIADAVIALQEVKGEELGEAIETIFDRSYAGLTPESRLAFRLLGLIKGSTFTSEAATALLAVELPVARRLLTHLADASLIQPTAPDRYCLNDLVRVYAHKLTLDEDDDRARTAALVRLATWYLSKCREISDLLTSESNRPRPILDWIVKERPNLIAIIIHTHELGQSRLAWDLADAGYDLFDLGRYASNSGEVRREAERYLALCRAIDHPQAHARAQEILAALSRPRCASRTEAS
ncbi:NB-ARC domain-containing protein [Sphaerisporangium sp. TRM90804]|uniref:ATP-binding protein n=1 Tax=Sphaerisporangium sp. TRM90804 TaxID=3031113 RepID=UPI00244789CB|nr:NB-ARC domain-containing protein [Sphaerisporangium sp. TRM90804]MDH2426450.1 NB-ARC domain-containing protein [Sphaerisporangium sp. TRM90804]